MAGVTKYFLDTAYQVINGQIVYASHINDPFAAIGTGFAAVSTDIQTGGSKYGADTGAADAYVVALDPPITSYAEGQEVWLKPSAANTGAATINVNSVGVKSIKRHGLAALAAGDLPANYYTQLKYSSGVFQVVSTSLRAEVSADAAAASAVLTAADVVSTGEIYDATVLAGSDAVAAVAAQEITSVAAVVAQEGLSVTAVEGVIATISGLESITEGANTGWRFIGRTAANYGDIGNNAVDLSYSAGASSTLGATQQYSFASGYETTASGLFSHAIGFDTLASNTYSYAEGQSTQSTATSSHAEGNSTLASGDYSHAGGSFTVAQNSSQTSIGRYNVGTDTGTILEVGIGTGSSAKANGLEVHTDGKVLMPNLPTSDPAEAGALWNDSGTLKISAG